MFLARYLVPLVLILHDGFGLNIPLFITPLRDLPQPRVNTSSLYNSSQADDFFSKVTAWDVQQASNDSASDLYHRSVLRIVNDARNLYERSLLSTAQLRVYQCDSFCYSLNISDVVNVSGKSSDELNGLTRPPITLGQLHEAVIETLQRYFCFNMSLIEMELGISSFNVTLNEWKLFLPKIAESSLHCHSNMLRVQPSEMAELLNTSVSTIISSNLEQLKNRLILPFTDYIIKRKNVFEDEEIKKLVSSGSDSQNWFSFPLYNLILSTTNLSVRALEILYSWNTNQLYALQTVVLSSYRSCGNVTSIEKTMYNISKIILEDLSCPVGLALSRSVKLIKTLHLPEENVRRLSVLEIFFKATSMDSWIEVANLLGVKLNSGLILDTPLLREIVKDNAGLSQEQLENLSIPRIISTYIPINDFFYTFNKFAPKFRQLLSTYGFTREELLQSSGLRIINTTTISELHDTVLKTLFLRYDVRNIVSLVGYSDYFLHDSNLTTLPSLEWPKIINALKQQSYKQVVQAFSLNIYDHPDALSIITREDGFRTIKTSIFGPFNVTYINNLSMCLFNKTLRSVEQNNFSVYEEFYIKNLTVTTTKKIRFENVTVQNFLSDTSQTLDEIEHTTLLKSVEMATGFQLEEIRCLYGESFVSTLNSSLTWENVMETRLCYTFTNLTFLQLITAVQNAPVVDCEIQACAICDRQATCDDSSSNSYRCTCLNGYEGNGLVCSDKDECENSTVCHEQATCTNTIGSYICTCRAGFTGDGSRNCTDTNECSNPSACHPLAICINNIGSYNCTCQSGYIGDGRFQCTVIDSSSSSSPPSSSLSSSPSPSGQSSSDSNTVVIVVAVVVAVIIIVAAICIVGCFLYRKKTVELAGVQTGTIQNAAYESDKNSKRKLPQVPKTENVYDQLDETKMVPIDKNYQSLLPRNTDGSTNIAVNYVVVGENEQDKPSLEQNKLPESYVTIVSEKSTTIEPIYEELPP